MGSEMACPCSKIETNHTKLPTLPNKENQVYKKLNKSDLIYVVENSTSISYLAKTNQLEMFFSTRELFSYNSKKIDSYYNQIFLTNFNTYNEINSNIVLIILKYEEEIKSAETGIYTKLSKKYKDYSAKYMLEYLDINENEVENLKEHLMSNINSITKLNYIFSGLFYEYIGNNIIYIALYKLKVSNDIVTYKICNENSVLSKEMIENVCNRNDNKHLMLKSIVNVRNKGIFGMFLIDLDNEFLFVFEGLNDSKTKYDYFVFEIKFGGKTTDELVEEITIKISGVQDNCKVATIFVDTNSTYVVLYLNEE